MQKEKLVRNVRFDTKTFVDLSRKLESMSSSREIKFDRLKIEINESESWTYDTFEEFLAGCGSGLPILSMRSKEAAVRVQSIGRLTTIDIQAPKREQIEEIYSILERDLDRCRIPEDETAAAEAADDEDEDDDEGEDEPLKVFIGHGRNALWKELKDHLHEKHGIAVVAYEIGARGGLSVRDILEEMLEESDFALLVMTGEDETRDGNLRARQNVVHEVGLFQGRLGFSRAIVLLEEGTEDFSNITGLHELRFSKGNIKETFGDVLATIRREFE